MNNAEQEMRERFEAWANDLGYDLDTAGDGTYLYTNDIWEAWQAAAEAEIKAAQEARDQAAAEALFTDRRTPDLFAPTVYFNIENINIYTKD